MRLSEKAYLRIKEKIVSLDLKPLAVIDEHALMEDLGLGRTPIREALHRLAAENLVIIAPRRGMFVAEISITDLQKVFEVRTLLEGFCARLAAQRATEEHIAQMEATFEALEQLQSEDSKALIAVDQRFHELLYQAADNEFLTDSLCSLYALSLRLWNLVLDHVGDVKEAVKSHRDLTEALRARDEAQAEALIRQQLTQFQEKIKAAL